ncbi:sterol desaturase family protein, partial [Pseudomonas protegens]|uniref:sterol desaturase family protein n=1 Tax=Pseudomonas protegens TaxID=380021 RepID=UPI0011CE61BE
GLWPQGWPLWGQLLLATVIADCGITLAHYASHRLAWLWRLHAVHHSVQRMYGFNGLLTHPLHQSIEASAGLLPLALLGIPLPVAQLLALAIAV